MKSESRKKVSKKDADAKLLWRFGEGYREGYRFICSKKCEISQIRFVSFLLDSFMDIVTIMDFKANHFFFFVVGGIEYEIVK